MAGIMAIYRTEEDVQGHEVVDLVNDDEHNGICHFVNSEQAILDAACELADGKEDLGSVKYLFFDNRRGKILILFNKLQDFLEFTYVIRINSNIKFHRTITGRSIGHKSNVIERDKH